MPALLRAAPRGGRNRLVDKIIAKSPERVQPIWARARVPLLTSSRAARDAELVGTD